MNLTSTSSVFENYFFSVPDYQRGYAWEEKQVQDFWLDIDRARREHHKHFCGTVMLERKDASSSEKMNIVDGQQRLTTIAILASAIYARLAQSHSHSALRTRIEKLYITNNNTAKITYSNNHDSWQTFRLEVLNDSSAGVAAADVESAYAHNIRLAKKKFNTFLSSLTDDEVVSLVDTIEDSLVFNLFLVDSTVFDVHMAFESINHRGKQLTQLELLKNRLIYISRSSPGNLQVGSRNTTIVDYINETWGSIYRLLGQTNGDSTALDEDEFLRTHTIVYWKVDTSLTDWLEKVLFEQEFPIGLTSGGPSGSDSQSRLKKIQLYLESLDLAAYAWSHIRRPRNMPSDFASHLESIERIHRPVFGPLLLSAFMKVIINNRKNARDIKTINQYGQCLLQLLKEVERFIVMVYILSSKRAHTGRKEFYRTANAIYDSDDSISIKETIDNTSMLIRARCDNVEWEGEDSIAEYTYPNFRFSGWSDLSIFERDIVKDLGHEDGYYGTIFARLVLFEYEEQLRRNGKAPPKVKWKDVGHETIEHIYPQDDSNWREFTRSIAHGKFVRRINSYRHSLGNLVLLNRSKNSSLSNKPFSGPNGKRVDFRVGSYSENEVAKNLTWTLRKIEQRGVALLRFAEGRWDFSFGKTDRELLALLVIPPKS